jgi:hypothetical protein
MSDARRCFFEGLSNILVDSAPRSVVNGRHYSVAFGMFFYHSMIRFPQKSGENVRNPPVSGHETEEMVNKDSPTLALGREGDFGFR